MSEETKTNRWANFSVEELEAIDHSFAVTDGEGSLGQTENALWDEVKREWEKRTF